jgi:hypothetical protein
MGQLPSGYVNKIICDDGLAVLKKLPDHFDVDLNIITLLEGERKVDQPIHKKDFYKGLDESSVKKAANVFEDLLKKF